MRRTMIAVLALAVLAALALPAGAAAEEAKLKIGGTTYTKWLWGTQRYDGSLYNFTTVPGEGYGDNGQGSEVELLLSARLSKEVNVAARLHSRVLMDAIVRDPADVDMGLILGIGFPTFRGGILRWADAQGLAAVLERLKRYEALGPRFHPTEQMRRLAAEARGFYAAR